MFTSNSLALALEAINVKQPRQQLTYFPLFSSLPTELRLKIWSYACTPRIIPIRHHNNTTSASTSPLQRGRTSKPTTRFSTTAAPPVLLSVCAESRAQALRIYDLTFGTSTSEARIYFCPRIDTLYFERYREMGYDESVRDFKQLVSRQHDSAESRRRGRGKLCEEVRSIALDYVDVNIKRPWESYNKACLIRSFPNLEEISLVIKPTKASTPSVQQLEDVDANQRRSGKSRGAVAFSTPKVDPERLLRWWGGFRYSFAVEEKMLESASARQGKQYEHFSLPVVNLVTKC